MAILQSRIEAVKVYHTGATVYRAATLEPVDGKLPDQIELQGLPLALLDPTVRVRVESALPQGADLLATDVRVGLHALAAEAAGADADREELKRVGRRLLQVELLLRQIELERSYLTSMQVPERPQGEEGKPPPASPTSARVLLEQFVEEGTRTRLQEARALRRELKELGERAAELEDRIRRASTARQARPSQLRKTVIARLLQSGEQPATGARLVIEYYVPGVCWAPAYQCRLTRDCRQADILLRALVAQRSGEDWRGVKLTLSTASALSWSELPQLESIRIGRSQPPPPVRRGFRPPPRGADSLFGDFDRERQLVTSMVPPAPSWEPPLLSAVPPQLYLPAAEALERPRPFPRDTLGAMAPEMACSPQPLEDIADEYEAERTEDRIEERRAGIAPRRSMPPPPPAPAMQAPPMARRPPPITEASAPIQALAKGSRSERRKRSAARDEAAYSVGAAAPEPGLPEEQAPAVAAVLFSQLRLAGPDAGDRGRLLPLDMRAAYVETLERQHLDVDFDPLQVAGQAQRAAASVSSVPLPDGAYDVRQSSGRFDYCYHADAPVDLESDGCFHSLPVDSLEAASQVCYIVVPREETAAYRMATLKNPMAAPLLPGPVEVHVGGDYVLSTTLPLVARGGEFQLGLGVEQAIKVARNTEFSEVRSGEKVVAMTELRHQIRVDLHNHLDREILCEVRERLPQPDENAEVVVEETEVDPAWTPYTQAERRQEIHGGRRWQVRIGAGKPAALRAAYTVKIYANNELCGGNRREA